MQTEHSFVVGDARDLPGVDPDSIHLVVTSPPYPMIAMWDEAFAALSPVAAAALASEEGPAAFEAMHAVLDPVWIACHRALVPGGLLCVNIGDATRTVGGEFRLYPNHARIIAAALAAGFSVLPDVLWRKPTNAPNKFMGSGMLPAGAYVTYEHEYVLVLRKGPPRRFPAAEEKALRRRSAFFWEERNSWFSDVWADLPGARQELPATEDRARSAAFPLEIPWRLVHMYSLQGDVVLDPFAGTGTTMLAAAAAGRSSIGIERLADLGPLVGQTLATAPRIGEARIAARLDAHRAFVAARTAAGKPPKHENAHFGFPVVTGQERDLAFPLPIDVGSSGTDRWRVSYRWEQRQRSLFS